MLESPPDIPRTIFERLDTRMLLSGCGFAVPAASPLGPAQLNAVVTLLNDELVVRSGELSVLTLAIKGVNPTNGDQKDESAFLTIEGDLMNVDTALHLLGFDAAEGKIHKGLLEGVQQGISDLFRNVSKQLPLVTLPGDTQLLPAVQKFRRRQPRSSRTPAHRRCRRRAR